MKHSSQIKTYLLSTKRNLTVDQIRALDEYIDWQEKQINKFFEELKRKYDGKEALNH